MTAPRLASPVQELARLRAENDRLRALIVASDPATEPGYWLALFRDGHRADIDAAYRQGRADLEAEYAADWRSIAEPVAHPKRYAQASAQRRMRAAEAGQRRDAAEHERAFVARAHNTHDRNRTDVQRSTVHLYPREAGAE